MNKKLFGWIGLGFVLAISIIYTTTSIGRTSPAANLENLEGCATERNPNYLAHVLIGAINAYEKDAAALLKKGDIKNLEKKHDALIKVLRFTFKDSKHFSPIFKSVAHKPAFEKAINTQIQKMFKAEYAAAKDQRDQGMVVKNYRAIVKTLSEDGLKGLSKIVSPKKQAKKDAKKAKKAGKDKSGMKQKLAHAGKKLSEALHKAAESKVVKHAKDAVKKQLHAKLAAVKGDDAPAQAAAASDEGDAPADEEEAPADEGEAPAEEEEAPADDEDAPAEEEDTSADEEDAPADDEEAPADEEEAPADEEDDAPADDEEAPADEEDAPAEEEDASADDEEASDDEGDADSDSDGDAGSDDDADNQ